MIIEAKVKLKCVDCNHYLNEELFCIKCSRRVSGEQREKLLEYYNKYKLSKFGEELFHVAPNHIGVLTSNGCVDCNYNITETMFILAQVDSDFLPEFSKSSATFYKLIKDLFFIKRITRDINYKIEMDHEFIEED